MKSKCNKICKTFSTVLGPYKMVFIIITIKSNLLSDAFCSCPKVLPSLGSPSTQLMSLAEQLLIAL